ncbi:hypothetical protein [Paludisphaera rhizosphaerae]|uniref:hypothetical protein n=1 Tax=Paludisphaera rhizosphaerae TaxID=2711216 RepID=UPI0013ED517A|nr:hypothetical protein [Paludisphaera rhizosphaerae]
MRSYWECPKCRALLTRDRLEATAGACPYCDARVGEPAEFVDRDAHPADVEGRGFEPLTVPPTTPAKIATALRLLFEQLPVIAALVLMIRLPGNIAAELIVEREGLGGDPLASIPMKLVVDLFFGPITAAGLIVLLAERMSGRRSTFQDVARAGVEAWWRVFAARVVATFFVLSAGVVFFLVGLPPVIRLLGAIPALILYVYYCLVDEVIVLEHSPILDSRRRSARLVAGRAWRIVAGAGGVILIIGLVSVVVGGLLDDTGLLADPIIRAVADSLLGVLGSLGSIVLFLFYWEAQAESLEDVAYKPALDDDPR